MNSEITESEEDTETLKFNSNTTFSGHHDTLSSSFNEFQIKWKSLLPPDVFNRGNYISIIEMTEPWQDVLTEQLIENCSKEFGPILKPGCVAMTRCDLSKQGLKNISVLKYHKYLTHLDLSANYLNDISCLSHLRLLNYLDVSQNLLTRVLDFQPPIQLRFVNYAFNLIGSISDLSSFWSLEYLNLSHNLIDEISEFQNMWLLNHLDLSYNYIKKVENFQFLNIEHLILDNNQIKSFSRTSEQDSGTLIKCQTISMAFNQLDSLISFQDMPKLRKLLLKNNLIASLGELAYLKSNVMIQSLDLQENPIQKVGQYLETVMHYLKRIEYLDEVEIDAGMKGAVNFQFSTSKEIRASCYNSIIDIISNMTSPVVDELHPGIESVPIIVLVGPTASEKIRVAKLLQTISPNIIHLGVSHTTRPKSKHEIDGEKNYFISKNEFTEGLKQGKFLTCIIKYGHYFGISKEELKKGLYAHAILFCADICVGMQLKGRFPHCKFIFAMSKSVEIHKNWLLQHFYANPWISTSIQAYILSYQALKSESSDDILRMKKTCTNILEEIIQYIELIHERKSIELEGESSNTIKICYNGANWASTASVTSASKLTTLKSSKKPQSVCFSNDTNIVPPVFDLTTKNMFRNKTDTVHSNASELCTKFQIMDQVHSSLSKLHRMISDRSSVASKTVQWLNAPPDGISQYLIKKSVKYDDDSFGEQTSSYMRNFSINTFNDEKICSTISDIGSRYSLEDENEDLCIIGEGPKEEHPACLKIFIKDQLRKRNEHNSEFCNNPGLYYYKVHTDKLLESAHLVSEIINEILQLNDRHVNQSKEKIESVKNVEMMTRRSDYILRDSC